MAPKKRKLSDMTRPVEAVESPRVYLRLKKNSEGEWYFPSRFDGERLVRRVSVKSPQGAGNVSHARKINFTPCESSSSTNSSPKWEAKHQLRPGVIAFRPKTILRQSKAPSQSTCNSPDNNSAKNVRINSRPDIKYISSPEEFPPSQTTSFSKETKDGKQIVIDTLDSSPESSDYHGDNDDNSMSLPRLKLSMGSKTSNSQDGPSTPASAVARTPTLLKLNFGGSNQSPVSQSESATPVPSTKKRRRTQKAMEADAANESSSDDENEFKKPAPIRRLTIKHAQPKPVLTQTPTSGVLPAIKLKYKGKIPRRPLGVGYDSENEDTERDPVILEGFILRMAPGDDADYLRKAIADGTVGLPRASGGADCQVRFFDTHGRRGVVVIRQRKYAAAMVDLPCIVEGMKSWDRKGWIKSIDISQMLLVLGKVNTDDEARNYPLPPDVDPKTHQYAHGLTAPMRLVRTRRFNRTKRTRVDDIEAVERRVQQLLAGDEAADTSTFELLDYDPREANDVGEESGEYETDSAEGEGDEQVARGAYSNGIHGQVENPHYEPVADEDIAELEDMFDDDDDGQDDSHLPMPQLDRARDSLHPPEDASSFAVTSTSGTPSGADQTPASAQVEEDSGDEEDEEDDDGHDDSANEAEEEGDEIRQQALDRIEDLKKKIEEQMVVMKTTDNRILKKKIAGKIAGLKADVEQMRKGAGLESDEDD